jgi:aldehyde:ferredoxin oxidoreductase
MTETAGVTRAVNEQRILNVDLSAGSVQLEDVPREELELFLGGRGIGAKLLYERVPVSADPLGAVNVLIIATGTLTGTSAPSSGRTSLMCKGPATGYYLKVSGGGHFGAALRYAGYDYLVIRGVADRPVYLWIDDEAVLICDARDLWGLGTRDTDRLIKLKHGDEDIETAVIGPAGENKVLYSCVVLSVYNSASRGGVGAVMGSKGLKAIAVRGSGGLAVAEGNEFFRLAGRMRRELADDSGTQDLFRWGTASMVVDANETGELPSYNLSRGSIEGAERISGQWLEESGYLIGRESCFSCSTACHRYIRTKQHRFGEVQDSGPEYETTAALGSECGIVDTEAVLKANHLCNDYGLDTISTGHVISWAMECYEKGLIKGSRTECLDLHFGAAKSQLELIRRIALREGALGDLLANGTEQAAKEVGGDSWKWAIQAKGLEQSCVDTRAAKAYALSFAVNPRGPDHLMTECIAEYGSTPEARALIQKIAGHEKYASPTLVEKKAEIVRWHEDCYAACDALGFCAFGSTLAFAITPENMAQLLGYAVGTEVSADELMRAGRRIVTLERCFYTREGGHRKHDVLPWRMMNEPMRDGPNKGMMTDSKTLDVLLDQYYDLHGWDRQSGAPSRAALERLGLLALCGDALTD